MSLHSWFLARFPRETRHENVCVAHVPVALVNDVAVVRSMAVKANGGRLLDRWALADHMFAEGNRSHPVARMTAGPVAVEKVLSPLGALR